VNAPSGERDQGSLLISGSGLSTAGLLERADGRGRYLDVVSRTVSSMSHPARGVETFAASLVGELVDFAQVVIRTHVGWLAAGQTRGHAMVDVHTYEVGRQQARVITELMQQRLTEVWALPPDTPQRAEMLRHLFGTTELVGQVDRLRAETLLSVPLVARGRAFGLITVARSGGRGFDAEASGFIEEVALRMGVSLDACAVVADNRHVAATLRRSLLPSPVDRTTRLDVASYSRVAQEDITVGGDFIDLHGGEADQTLLVGDAVGKGVVAAIAAKRIRSSVRTGSLVDRDPAWVMALTNRVLAAEDDDDAVAGFATALCARLERLDGPDGRSHLRASVVNAGHPPPVILRHDGRVELLDHHGPALGVFDDVTYEAEVRELDEHDLLICYTDGVSEARGERDLFGQERLLAALEGLAGAPASAVVERVAMAVSQFVNEREDRDDIAIIALRLLPGGENVRR
jgi:GAF domain-containing protein